jgi:hypothetical protein
MEGHPGVVPRGFPRGALPEGSTVGVPRRESQRKDPRGCSPGGVHQGILYGGYPGGFPGLVHRFPGGGQQRVKPVGVS